MEVDKAAITEAIIKEQARIHKHYEREMARLRDEALELSRKLELRDKKLYELTGKGWEMYEGC